ncbi:MAG: hypothetical protein HY866_02210 [Chloroflexi bacterium]|nr:hypothetical protein [Chloroflexota bacterium]
MPPGISLLPLSYGYDPSLKADRRATFAGELVVVECVPGEAREEDLRADGYTLTAQKTDPNTGLAIRNVWAKLTSNEGC